MEAENSITVTICKKQNISPKNKKNVGMACHAPLLKKVNKQGEMPLATQPRSQSSLPQQAWEQGYPETETSVILTVVVSQ